MNKFSASSLSILVTCCISIRFRSLYISLDIVLPYTVLSRRIPEANLSASQEPIGKMHPMQRCFLMFGKQSSSANSNASKSPSGCFGIWYPSLPSNRSFSFKGSFLLLSIFIFFFCECLQASCC